MVQTVKKMKADLGTQYDPMFVKPADARTKFISRFKGQNFTPKETSPGVLSIPIGEATPSRPQLKEIMNAGGTKANLKRKAKIRRAIAAGKAHDPGQTPYASTKVHWPTNDAAAKKGYKVGKAWKEPKISAVHSDTVSVTAPHA